ncbi:cell division cycle-associated protein 2 isoform X2 [Nycticebus coucang]|uniref:cell division cycle-associated protein 2 isoform X2 n=1 Tax=Nycticebus coucang TaxID=9470 RepID=UPI00234C28B4|nr:cell division cycle-associated protein 2 isoform X2 [Nycticebus coucang]
MDANSKDKPSETKESAINDAENACFILGTGNIVTPQERVAEIPPNLCTPDPFKSPLNFSTVTVEQLGITPESFVKSTSGRSPSSLKKSRRRSAIGARGSPETNHLIRFIAQRQSLKNARRCPLAQNSPAQGSPVLYRNVNSLRERMSAFQSAFYSIKENEKMADCLESSEAKRECEATDLTKKEDLPEYQQSGFPTELSSKRRRISSQSNSDENLTDGEEKIIELQLFSIDTDRIGAADMSADLSLKSSELGSTQAGTLAEASAPLTQFTEASDELKVADCVEDRGSSDAVSPDTFAAGAGSDTVSDLRSPVTAVWGRDLPPSETFVLRSVLKKPPVKLLPESLQEHCNNLYDDKTPRLLSNPANCCKERKVDEESFKTPTFVNMRKRKRVTFGEDLSPEVFDESLPANTPLRKGGTPVCKKDLSDTNSQPLEMSLVPEILPQPNFDDKGENLENIEPLQISSAVLSPSSKSPISETLSGPDPCRPSNSHEKIASGKVGAITRTSNKRNQLISFAEDSAGNLFDTEAQPCKEKKINRRKSQETKYANRAVPKKNQVLKSYRKKKRMKKKSVQKSLYGERDIASKKPVLSPIPEVPEVSEMTPSGPGCWGMCSDDFNSNGKLEEVKMPKNPVTRINLLPLNLEDLHMNQGFDKHVDSDFCSSRERSSFLDNATSDESPNVNDEKKHIPQAESKLESKTEPQTGADSHIAGVSGTEEHTADDPELDFITQAPELAAAAGQNAETLCQRLKMWKDLKCEKQDDCLVAVMGKLQRSSLLADSQKELNRFQDALTDNKKESKRQKEDLGNKSAKSLSVRSCRERKLRRYSSCYSDSQSSHLEGNGNHKPSHHVGSSAEISIENSELYKDLSDAIEQTFQRTKSETRVRRSTRLQKDSESEGLVWIPLPFPSTSRNTRRRTVCTGFETLSPRKDAMSCRQKPCVAPSFSDTENIQGPAADSSDLPGKRRKSFCTSTLENAKTSAQSTRCRRSSFVREKEGSSLMDFAQSGDPSSN